MKLYQILRKTQKDLKKAIKKEWQHYGYEVIEGDGFLYKAGQFPVLLVAHMDTVHEKRPTTIHKRNDILSSPMGIGGDDRCGIFMILEIIKKYDCAVLFTEDEEIGCIGAGKFAKSKLAKELKDKFCYIVELDRRGSKDAVFYDCDNRDFEDFVTEKHWITNWGSYSDICEIAPELNAAAVNLSCGYYDEHTAKETINLAEMNRNITEVCKMLARTDETKKFEYVEAKYGRNWWNSLGGTTKGLWNDYYGCGAEYAIGFVNDKNLLDIWCEYANSDYEAIGMFLMDHPNMTANDISFVELYDDYMWEEREA